MQLTGAVAGIKRKQWEAPNGSSGKHLTGAVACMKRDQWLASNGSSGTIYCLSDIYI